MQKIARMTQKKMARRIRTKRTQFGVAGGLGIAGLGTKRRQRISLDSVRRIYSRIIWDRRIRFALAQSRDPREFSN
jgi:hypothetical protein